MCICVIVRVWFVTLVWVFGRGTPTDPCFQPYRGAVCVAGLVSVIPYPERHVCSQSQEYGSYCLASP